MAEFAKTDDVHHHVFVKLHAELQRQLGCQHHGFRVVAIDVQHGRFNHLDHIRAVQRRAAVARVTGGKANLVVDHQMHRAACEITSGFGQCQGFHDHALSRKRRVAMHQHGQHLQALGV